MSTQNYNNLPHGAGIPEPMPVHNDSPAIWDLVIEDMHARDSIGKDRYNTRLQPFNGRDALMDAYQEVLDMAAYLRQVIYERDNTNITNHNRARIDYGLTNEYPNAVVRVSSIGDSIPKYDIFFASSLGRSASIEILNRRIEENGYCTVEEFFKLIGMVGGEAQISEDKETFGWDRSCVTKSKNLLDGRFLLIISRPKIVP